MDCSWGHGNMGCNGGEMVNAYVVALALAAAAPKRRRSLHFKHRVSE